MWSQNIIRVQLRLDKRRNLREGSLPGWGAQSKRPPLFGA